MDALTPPLEGDYAPVYAAYVDELSAVFDEVSRWWEALRATHDRRLLKRRWPAGPASHPRVLAVFRRYHAQVLEIGRGERSPALRFDDEAAWGSEAEPAPGLLVPPAPERVLIDRLQVDAEALYAKMIYLLMLPIGEAPQPRPSMATLAPPRFDPRPPQVFEFGGRHEVARGLRRLLGAGIDLRPRSLSTLAPSEAGMAHRQAFAAYERDLEAALSTAERWWGGLLAVHERRGYTSEEAHDAVWAEHRLGPVTHPRVLGVIQAYWGLCHEINAVTTSVDKQLAPELLLLAWLRDGRHESWVEVLTAMPYWPVGQDASGAWV